MSREEFIPIVVTDFGLSRVMDATFCETGVGSLPYVAPECWQRHYTTKIDIWALGCIMYGMCTRRVAADNVKVMFADVNRADFKTSVRKDIVDLNGYSNQLATFILSTFEPDPKLRPTSAQLLGGIKKLYQQRPSAMDAKSLPPQMKLKNTLFAKGAAATKQEMSNDAQCVFFIDPDFVETKDDPNAALLSFMQAKKAAAASTPSEPQKQTITYVRKDSASLEQDFACSPAAAKPLLSPPSANLSTAEPKKEENYESATNRPAAGSISSLHPDSAATMGSNAKASLPGNNSGPSLRSASSQRPLSTRSVAVTDIEGDSEDDVTED
eukprot:GILI01004201.1.p1 GENE.GILI01004201.1~~GILI01004201.1.p1  ORF type:complete len:347 (+),score=69.39 GILI01004201.1:68-1042(+)